jgi:hypothetical protein
MNVFANRKSLMEPGMIERQELVEKPGKKLGFSRMDAGDRKNPE